MGGGEENTGLMMEINIRLQRHSGTNTSTNYQVYWDILKNKNPKFRLEVLGKL